MSYAPPPLRSCLPIWYGDRWECDCGWCTDPEQPQHEADEEAWRHIPANARPRGRGTA